MKNLLLVIGLIVFLASCHTAKKATVTKAPETVQRTDTTANSPAVAIAINTPEQGDSIAARDTLAMLHGTDTVPLLTESAYRFKVSFFSIGEGIDDKAKRKYTGFIQDYASKSKTRIPYEEINSGMEGETDFGFKLAELNAVQQAKFISDSKEFLKEFELVRYSEHITPQTEPGKGPGLQVPH